MSESIRYHLSLQQKQLIHLDKKGTNCTVQILFKVDSKLDSSQIKSLWSSLLEQNETLTYKLVEDDRYAYPLQEVNHLDEIRSNWCLEEGSITEAMKKLDFNRTSTFSFLDAINDTTCTYLILTAPSYFLDTQATSILADQIGNFLKEIQPIPDREAVTYLEFAQWYQDIVEELSEEELTYWTNYELKDKGSFNLQKQTETCNLNSVKSSQISEAITSKLGENDEIKVSVLTAWNVLMSKHNNYHSQTIGYQANLRSYQELAHVTGLMGHTLPFTTSLAHSDTLKDAFDSTKKTLADLYDHEYYYLSQVDIEKSLVSGIGFEYIEQDQYNDCINVLAVHAHHQPFTLKLTALRSEKHVDLQFSYDSNSFSEEAIICLQDQLLAILDLMQGDGNITLNDLSFPLVSKAPPKVDVETLPDVLTVFEKVVEEYPEKTAVEFNGRKLTYSELAGKASKLAQFLYSEFQLKAGDNVGVLLERSDQLIISLLAIMRCNATYVPIDPKDSPARMEHTVTDSNCKLIIEDGSAPIDFQCNAGIYNINNHGSYDEVMEEIDLPRPKGTDTMYMIYTSGTSGKPKGVPISHGSLTNYVNWIKRKWTLTSNDSLPLITSHAYDHSYTALWGMLLTGGSIQITSEYMLHTPEVLLQYLLSKKVSMIHLTPSILNLFWSELKETTIELLSQVRLLILGGESFSVDLITAIWQELPNLRIINHYGPTETTIGVLAHELDPKRLHDYARKSIIGELADNHHVLILDENNQQCGYGLSGQICIAGAGVFKGYYGQSELTKRKFISFYSRDYYKTGDKGYINEYDEVVFQGRLDTQVKINGYRVELEEIKQTVEGVVGIEAAIIQLLRNENSTILACFYTSKMGVGANELKVALKEKLPLYMIPGAFRKIPHVPLTKNGKINYSSLPAIETGGSDREVSDGLEATVLSIVKEVLNNENLGVNDNFFESGGDSIKSIQIASRMHQKGYDLSVNDIFNNPTVALMALVTNEVQHVEDLPSQGYFPMPPVYHYFFNTVKNPHHYNQAAWFNIGSLSREIIGELFQFLMDRHDALRIQFDHSSSEFWRPYVAKIGQTITVEKDELDDKVNMGDIEEFASQQQAKIKLTEGPLIKLHLVSSEEGVNYLLVIMHHLITDIVSWGILIAELNQLIQLKNENKRLELPIGSSSFMNWSKLLNSEANSAEIKNQLSYWESIPLRGNDLWPNKTPIAVKDFRTAIAMLSEEESQKFFDLNAKSSLHGTVYLLTALGMTLNEFFGINEFLITMEGHGRENLDQKTNIYNTIGWFTSLYPFYFTINDKESEAEQLTRILKAFKKIPQKTIGYGMLKYAKDKTHDSLNHQPNIRFNFLGNDTSFDNSKESKDIIQFADLPTGFGQDPDELKALDLDIVALVSDQKLVINLSFGSKSIEQENLDAITEKYQENLQKLLQTVDMEERPSNHFKHNNLSQEEIDNFFNQ